MWAFIRKFSTLGGATYVDPPYPSEGLWEADLGSPRGPVGQTFQELLNELQNSAQNDAQRGPKMSPN